MINRLRPIFRTAPIILAVAMLTLAGGWFGHVLGTRMRISSDRAAITSYSDQLLAHAIDVIAETNGAIDAANASPQDFCSPAEIELMRNMLFAARNLKDIGRIKDGHLICSTILGKTDGSVPMPQGPYTQLADGTRIYPDTPLAVSDSNAPVVDRGNANAVIDPRAFDTLKDPPFHYGIFYGDVGKKHLARIFGEGDAVVPAPADGVAWSLKSGILRRDGCSEASGLCISVWARLSELDAFSHGIVNAIMLLGAALGALGGLTWVNFRRRDQSLMARLSRALAHEELTLLYQPVVNVADGKIVGAEALVRWQSNESKGDFVPPDVFIAIAEQKGIAGRVTRYVLNRAIEEMAETLRLHDGFRITINIVASDLSDPKFFAALDDGLRRGGLSPRQIGIELTERSTADSSAAIEGIARLRSRGHIVYLDDFGTGYSSLSYLGELDVDVLKMDRAFTRTVGTDAVTVSIVPQIIDMAIKHNLSILVEGIETAAQATYFRNLPVPVMGQGWYYGKPVSAAALTKQLEQQDGIVAVKKGRKRSRQSLRKTGSSR
ncbi:EAL domain-containing protein [Phyllobacterium phragmitis]|uniref:EAL domain-containing protein n=1 Tax=Phyllobacterium phragmitis TaxID=2670329 RepID=UPI00130502A8|nr:EAL domain-containing protein [Phyllobacterium phragmitis]